MNKILNVAFVGAVAISALLTIPVAEAGCAYVYDRSGQHVVHRTGECVITRTWTKEQATEQCHPDLIPKPVAIPKPPPPPPPPLPPPPPPPKPVYETITLQALALFDYDRSELKVAGRQELDEVISRIKSFDKVERIRVVGHTDSHGSEAYNQGLSIRRAEVVKQYLLSNGIDAQLLTSVGMGETQPVASNETKEGRAQNRRVEVQINGTKRVLVK